MNTMPPSDALLVAHTQLDALRASARAEELGRVAACRRGPHGRIVARVRSLLTNRGSGPGGTAEGSSTDRCATL